MSDELTLDAARKVADVLKRTSDLIPRHDPERMLAGVGLVLVHTVEQRNQLNDEVTRLTMQLGNLCIELSEEKRARETAESRLREYEDAPVVGYYVYVAEHNNGYVCETEDEYLDDVTNHGAEITELIIRPRSGKGE